MGIIVLLVIGLAVGRGPDVWPPALVVMACFALVAVCSLTWQWAWGKRVEDQIWAKLCRPDSLDKLEDSARGIVVSEALRV